MVVVVIARAAGGPVDGAMDGWLGVGRWTDEDPPYFWREREPPRRAPRPPLQSPPGALHIGCMDMDRPFPPGSNQTIWDNSAQSAAPKKSHTKPPPSLTPPPRRIFQIITTRNRHLLFPTANNKRRRVPTPPNTAIAAMDLFHI